MTLSETDRATIKNCLLAAFFGAALTAYWMHARPSSFEDRAREALASTCAQNSYCLRQAEIHSGLKLRVSLAAAANSR